MELRFLLVPLVNLKSNCKQMYIFLIKVLEKSKTGYNISTEIKQLRRKYMIKYNAVRVNTLKDLKIKQMLHLQRHKKFSQELCEKILKLEQKSTYLELAQTKFSVLKYFS